MTRPRTVSDQAILDAARHCAIERGPAVSLDVIAARVGVTSPALLKRFGSRQELMIAALRPSAPPAWVRDLEAGPDQRPLEEQLESLIDRVLDFFAREMPCMTALAESGFPLEKIFDRKQTPQPFLNIWALSAWMKRGQERGLITKDIVDTDELETIAASLLGALHGRVFLSDFMGPHWWCRSRDQFVSDLARNYTRALTSGRIAAPDVTADTRIVASPVRASTHKSSLPKAKRKKS